MSDSRDSRLALLTALTGHLGAERPGADQEIEIGTMFRSPGIKHRGKIVAFIGHDDRLIVKLPHHRALELIHRGDAEAVTMGTRTMREWVAIPAQPSRPETLDCWAPYVGEALTYRLRSESETE